MGWPRIDAYEDGYDVTAEVLNKPLQQLAQRTEYLRNLLSANDRTKVTVTVEFPSGSTPIKGTPVYRTGEDGAYEVASAASAQGHWFYADPSAMVVGVVGDPDTETGGTYVVLYGRLDFGETELPASDIIVDGNPQTGRYFLSTDAGKLTSMPSGPVIYVANCVIRDGYVRSMLVSPQYRDTGESHVHRELVLSGLPMGGYALKTTQAYTALDIPPDSYNPSSYAPDDSSTWPSTTLQVMGTWHSPDTTEYEVTVEPASSLRWTVAGESGTVQFEVGKAVRIGPVKDPRGSVFVTLRGSPEEGLKWTLALPEVGRRWTNHYTGSTADGFMLNLGFYGPEWGVPPVPNNAAALVVDGLEFRSQVHGDAAQWSFITPDATTADEFPGGPWIIWHGNGVIADSVTTPFNNAWGSSDTGLKVVTSRHLAFHTNRMAVGPTGFVTSLQVEPGSPLRLTDATTGALGMQGGLMLGMSLDFSTEARGVAGSEVVKAIHGSKFKTGQVVERIIAGPGVAVSGGGQGTVRVSISNAHYSGDFETIALRNAKQDLASDVFPYTKLLGWTGTGDTASGFTAKFRVPDYLPLGDYNVVVSASVFGEANSEDGGTAAFRLSNWVLGDRSLQDDALSPVGSVASPVPGKASAIPVTFQSGYAAFDPILVHGRDGADVAGQRQRVSDMLLKTTAGTPVVVRPGYFVGIRIDRQGPDGTPYTSPIGFMSLRWNLVEAQKGV